MDRPADRFGLAGAVLAGRYRIERQVAEGGFAVVYRGVQVALDRPIALKVLKTPPGLTDAARTRFENRFATEARTIAKLQHPYIVDVYDYGVSRMPSGESAPWMALEWLEGVTLEEDLDARRGDGGRGVAATEALLRPVIEAVAYAHRRGVVHRDIKPANIMVVPTDAGPMLRMLDFGIAKIMDGDPIGDTRPGRGSGSIGFSPDYAAPEQITYSRTGPWTDVHALGLLFTELLTDKPPFAASEDEQLFEQVMSPERPTPARRGVNAGRLENVIARALALSPQQRWGDAGLMLEALEALEARAHGAASRRRHSSVRRLHHRLAATAASVWASRPWRDPGGTWRIRRRGDLGMPVSGGLAIVSLVALAVWALGSPGAGPRRGPARVALAAPVSPWIIPLPACASGTAALTDTGIAPPTSARRPNRVPRPAAAPAIATDTLADQPCAVSVNSVPWSEVWIDGENTGRHTPLVDLPIDCGQHRLDFKRPDLHIAQTESIVVKAGQPFKRRYTLPGGAE